MDKDPISQNIIGVQSLVGSKMNKVNSSATSQVEGVDGEIIDEFTLKLSDEELLQLKKKWEAEYAGYETAINKRQDANKTYYLGKQKEGGAWATTDGQPIGGNLLFEAEETFLPAAFQKTPDPVVFADDTKEGEALSDTVKVVLEYLAKTLALRPKLQLMTRHWSIYFIGIIKHGWDNEIQEITSDVRKPRNFVFDPTGFVDCYGDFEGYLGERITVSARKLIELFPKHEMYITVMVDGKLGTDCVYTEWWNDDYTFTSFKDKVLEKNKNPHFNYKKTVRTLDQDGNVNEENQGGKNHFAKPKKPYSFLSVFSLAEQPHDITTLIEQNIPNQRRISRRIEQIDFNLSRQNNSTAFSQDNWTQETAKQAATAMAKGHPVLVPAGKSIDESIKKIDMTPVPQGFFEALERDEDQLRSIFGTQGITSEPAQPGDLATAKVLDQDHDKSRIGGGIGDKITITAENVYNWWTQMIHVYYDENHVASVLGQMKAVDYATLSMDHIDRKLVVSAAPNSMHSHDDASIRAEALELFQAGALDPKTLLTRVNFPDPQDVAEQTVLYHMNPQAYMEINFPEIAQQMAQIQQRQQAEQQAQQQQQMQVEGQQAEQGMAIQGAQAQQKLSQAEQSHQQKMKHGTERHELKMKTSTSKQKVTTKQT